MNPSIKLFPYLLARVSGGPFTEFAALNLEEAALIARKLWLCEQERLPLTERLSEALYDLVGQQTEAEVRVCLIRLRRDIFNERVVSPAQVTAVEAHLPPAIFRDMQQYQRIQADIGRLQASGAAAYARECHQARQQLKQLAQRAYLQKGLLLSSQSLSKYGLPDYLGQDSRTLNKQARKTEQSLIKYLSRIYAKTTPFSTFTNLAIGQMEQAELTAVSPQPISVPEDPHPISHIRLNNNLYRYLKILLTRQPDIYRHLALRPNPTLTQADDHYLFLINNDNIESFQRIPFNPVLALFQQLTASQRAGVPYRQVVQTIIEEGLVDASAAEIEAYLNELIAYGFLEFNLGVSGIDPDWDLKLNQQLAPLSQQLPLLDDLLHALRHLRQLAQQYGEAAVSARQTILQSAYTQFKAICLKLHQAADLPQAERQTMMDPTITPKQGAAKHRSLTFFPFRPEQMFYEDAALRTPLLIHQPRLRQLITTLDHLLNLLAMFEGHRDERSKMRHYFCHKYGRSATIDLLTFYEDYYREFKQPEARQQAPVNADTPPADADPLLTVAEIKDRQKQYHIWAQQIATTILPPDQAHTDHINLTAAQIEAVHEQLNIPSNGRCANMYGAFMQLAVNPSANGFPSLMAVINGSCPGFGKMMSRFLHLFDPEVTHHQRCWNQSFGPNALLLEDCDASYFNANLHPPLMPFEVWMPGGHNSLPPSQQVAVTELKVSLDETTNHLQLIHQPSQKRCYVFDLGFQGYRGRSELFQLLEQFTLADYLSYHPLLSALNNHQQQAAAADKTARIWVQPRIVYENQLILQRKAWFIPQTLLPTRQPGESDWHFFCRLNAWRLDQQMPDEVFVYIVNRHEFEKVAQEADVNLGQDDYKPQYICFHNPFLVALLEKLMQKTPHTLRLEEMLPHPGQLLSLGSEPYATELIVQWQSTREGQP